MCFHVYGQDETSVLSINYNMQSIMVYINFICILS